MIGKSGEDFLACFEVIYNWEVGQKRFEGAMHEVFKAYDHDFQDCKSTIVVIDEIQESALIYSRIREFAREFICDFIVTGSYLGKTREKDFFLSAGDTDSLILNTLSFPEFLDAFGKRELYNKLSPLGGKNHENYKEIEKYFLIYRQIGGYPKVVQTYLKTEDLGECRREIGKIVNVFFKESSRYFKSAMEIDLFSKMFPAIAITLIKEKKGTDDLITDFSQIVFKEESGKISKKMINGAISWLYLSHVIGYCGKSIDCSYLDIVDNCRFYFRDLGIGAYFLKRTGEREDTVNGILCENFVYLNLLKRLQTTETIAGESPWFAVHQETGGELDFYVRSLLDYKNYGIEVKNGKNPGKTAVRLLADGKIDFLYYLKGDTFGGKTDDGKILTVPVYMADKITFDLGNNL